MANPMKHPTTATTTDYDKAGCMLIALSMYVFAFTFIGLSTLPHDQTLDFRIESISTAPISFSPPSQITADWNITFSLPKLRSNLSAIYYDDVHASIYYKEVLLSKAEMDSIYLSEDNEWVPMAAVISANSVEARVLLNPGTKSMRNGSVSVYCEDVEAIFSIVRLSKEYAIRRTSKICALKLTEDTPRVLHAAD
ncbi:hypothetical protein LguiA_021521 [Lonicera macranthoides]